MAVLQASVCEKVETLTATWPLREAGFCLQLLGEDAEMVPNGLYLLIPGDVHSPRLHPQTPIS